MIDEKSKEYQLWKGFYEISYFEENYGVKLLYYDDSKGYKWNIDNISIKDFGEVHYLSWTEENGGYTKLIIIELQPHRNRRLEWTISPAKSSCFFWINKWTDNGLFIIYNDSLTNYALNVLINKKPKALKLEVAELGEMICIKRNWIIGFKNYTENTVSIFDLKSFCYSGTLSSEEAKEQNTIPTEQGENDEELE